VRLGVVLGLAVGAAALVAATVIGLTRADDDVPPSLQELKSGIGKVETLNCDGTPFRAGGHAFTGTGFLVGSRVVMTAEHGMYVGHDQPACRMRVRFGSETYAVAATRVWGEPGQRDAYERRGVDLATLTLARRVQDRHIFAFAAEGAPIGTPLATVGHPLGGPLRVSRGRVYKNVIDYGVPSLAATIDIEGGNSGGPMFNSQGEVLSVVSRVVISGSLTADKSSRYGGVDIPRWWGLNAFLDLCRTHPDGDIPDCDGTSGSATTKTSVLLKPASP
jgi:V8-like Glu-specific endopeptidase